MTFKSLFSGKNKENISNCLLLKFFTQNAKRSGAKCSIVLWGWSGGAKVLCILHHWGVQLILAYSWARPAILVVGKGRGGMFLLSHLLVAGCDIGVRFSVRPSVSPSVSPSVRLSTFMSTFDIYVKGSILINYKTKQPSDLA